MRGMEQEWQRLVDVARDTETVLWGLEEILSINRQFCRAHLTPFVVLTMGKYSAKQ